MRFRQARASPKSLIRLIDHQDLWERKSQGGLAAIRRRPLAREHALFANALCRIFMADQTRAAEPQKLCYLQDAVMSEEEANITACRHFCEHQRMLASREKKESATPKPSTTKAPLMRSLAHPNRAFYQAPDWEGALEIGYRDFGQHQPLRLSSGFRRPASEKRRLYRH